ncbi:photosystem II protein Psb27 [Prochlorococcus sp. MIT 1307]|uniref:photosystem II protein Psb27 n=1 Tax=Prochlorococcus sp. MIT 1307 TaxID=3096219 RepID=UPI002A74A6C5|nr:photosystem II protein Psb27 [Prochlorococcus sp. MIT 1307]
MTSAFQNLYKRALGAALAVLIGLCLILSPLVPSVEASGALMSGDYISDTVSVAHSLQETIAIPKDEERKPEAEIEAVQLITAYISRYRNRSQVNQSMSYTTMQTALNAMAGHYKTFPNRVLPDQLKERLNNELEKAAQLATKES